MASSMIKTDLANGMVNTRESGRAVRAAAGLGGSLLFGVVMLVLAWTAHQRLDVFLHELDVKTLNDSAKVLDTLVAQQSKHLSSSIGVLAEDARVRAMVLTPTFDRATVVDLLTDLAATSHASVIGILDGDGTVRAVVGAPEMEQLNLGTSSLVQGALTKPTAQLSAFDSKLGVLSATAVRLDNQVRAVFMLGFALDDALLASIEQTLGGIGAVFVGDGMAASANREPQIERALRSAAELSPGTYQVIDGAFLATSARMGDSAVSAKAAWLVPLQRHTSELSLLRALSWVPVVLAGLGVLLAIRLMLSQSRTEPAQGH